ncbi:Pkinase domain-containing protein/GUB_WAK_bind domain-containing protein/WAK_assoc domain-containing protein [Cephalotus follicularis]|uniref:non-specific serine/threonine protein kinase n=1 Tax=Cephalotus follicularis TaxID=3775 RepID=A0A1Q3CZ80_CEPFO|nr:Pkinase domain-containing protein/GUB_WAK_bind domain-containing protein/WAK_assoc domain-containing protein [Cephalotus follicularis]
MTLHHPLIFMIITIILTHAPISVSADEQYANCSMSFQCGNISDIGYPFYGANRPSYCGYPGFGLDCDGDTPDIEIMSQSYQVLDINSESRTLKVARADYVNDLCPTFLVNTTLNLTIFNYSSDTQNLVIYYGCPTIPNQFETIGLSSQFNCSINDTDISGYFVTRNITVSALADIADALASCDNNLVVPIFQSSLESLEINPTPENLITALDDGFGLLWNANESFCDSCKESGGQCGHDPSSSEFACYCPDKPSASICLTDQSSKGDNKISMKLGLGIGIGVAGSAGIFLAFWFLLIKRRRKKMVIQSKSKEITPPSSSNPTPSTNLSQSIPSQSIPSYPSSNFDLEKGSSYFGAQVFSFTELEEATDNFDPSKELGDGGFGTVYHGKLNDGRVVAVKRLYENNFKRAEQFMNEVEILTRLRHPNLVILFGCTSRRSRELLLVYEYIPNGTVADHLHGSRARSGLLTWPIRLSIAIETANALAYLHASDVIHRDVKTNNILLDNNFRVKVADFGLSRLFPTDVTHVSTAPQGTPGYVDPEYYQCYKLTDKSDVYSFGVVLVELISSKEAVDTTRHRHDINLSNMAVNRIQTHALHELIDPRLGFEKNYVVRTMITSVAELAFRCLQQDRDLRPSMEEVLAVLKEIVNEELRTQKAEVVDISADDVGLLQSIPPPHSPDSEVNDKWTKITTL